MVENQPTDKPPADKPPADKPPADTNNSPIQKAKETMEALKEQNDRMEANLTRQENILAEQMLHGKARAGQEAPTNSTEETPEEYSKKVMGGEI